jgi:nicotinamidase-related amidase
MSNKNKLVIDSLLNVGNVAVIVVDKQAGYVEDDSNLVAKYKTNTINLKKAFAKLDSFIQKARDFGVEIVWTQMLENQE